MARTDSHSPSPSAVELRALGALVHRLGGGAGADTPAGDADAPVDELPGALDDALVRRHLLAPLAYRAGIARFRSDFIANALLAEVRGQQLAETVAALAARRIPVMLFKGISYAGALYPEAADRPMSDIDILVRPEQFAGAVDALARLGYWAAGPAHQRSRLHHALTLKRRHAAIDLHRSVMQPWRARIDIEALWRGATPASASLPGALRPSPLDEAVLHLAHMARHELRVPAINYVDAARLLGRPGAAADQVLERARAWRMRRGVAAALAMTEVLTSVGAGAGGASPVRGLGRLGRVLPSADEVLADPPIGRPLQLARKLVLLDGPRELAGLLLAAAHGRLAGYRRA